MGYRVDACRIEIEVMPELGRRIMIRFELPPTLAELPPAATVAESLLAWNDARLLALAQAAGVDQMDLLRG